MTVSVNSMRNVEVKALIYFRAKINSCPYKLYTIQDPCVNRKCSTCGEFVGAIGVYLVIILSISRPDGKL